jgi:peptidoglycan/xylan/chitin deacetylase (PgdA/CDA1 family)
MTAAVPGVPLVTIVMYHFVRPVATSRFPRLTALELSAFREQLRYIRRHYSPVALGDLVAAAEGSGMLPSRPIVLTFDDGYRDHYANVYPLLADERFPAAFFPVRSALIDRRVLDVNKVQFILASVADVASLVGEIEAAVESSRDPNVQSVAEYRTTWWMPSRFDPPSVVYVKRMLQRGLPESDRVGLVDALFRRLVTVDEKAFAAELYFSIAEAREMRTAGMEFGGHGDRHVPMSALGPEDRAREIDGALEALTALGVSRQRFAFSFVKGEHDAAAVELLRARGCVLAVTTRVDLARPTPGNLLTLPRLDANDLPTDVNASPNEWTKQVPGAGQV